MAASARAARAERRAAEKAAADEKEGRDQMYAALLAAEAAPKPILKPFPVPNHDAGYKRVSDLPDWAQRAVMTGGSRTNYEVVYTTPIPDEDYTLLLDATRAAHVGALTTHGITTAFPEFDVGFTFPSSDGSPTTCEAFSVHPLPPETFAQRIALVCEDKALLLHTTRVVLAQILLAVEAAQYRVGLEGYSLTYDTIHLGRSARDPSTIATDKVRFVRPGDRGTLCFDTVDMTDKHVYISTINTVGNTTDPSTPEPEHGGKITEMLNTLSTFVESPVAPYPTSDADRKAWTQRMLQMNVPSYVARVKLQEGLASGEPGWDVFADLLKREEYSPWTILDHAFFDPLRHTGHATDLADANADPDDDV